MDLNAYASILRRRWIPLVACVATALVLAVAVTATTPRRYRATTRLFVNIPAAADVREALQGVQLSAQLLQSYAEIATSRSAASDISQRLGGAVSPDDVRSRLSAEPQPDTLLIDLVVLDKDRARARRIADAAAEHLTQSIRDLGPSPERAVEAQVIDRAVATGNPVSPRPKRTLSAALLLGLGAGVVLAFALESLRGAGDPARTPKPTAAPPGPADDRLLDAVTAMDERLSAELALLRTKVDAAVASPAVSATVRTARKAATTSRRTSATPRKAAGPRP